MYRTLKDAYEVTNDPRFLSGKTQIWYYKRSESRDFGMGSFGLERSGKWPSVENLSLTHVFIGFVDESNPSKVFQMMQGEYWSPNGEASTLPALRMAGHTSMSVGDIIVFPGSKALMVDMAGFYDLADAPVSSRMASMRTLAASDRSALIKLASSLPAGSTERRTILAGLQQKRAAGQTNIPNVHIFDKAKVYDEAEVSGDAKVYGRAEVLDNAKVYGNAEVFEKAGVFGDAKVFGNAKVRGMAQVNGKAKVSGTAQLYDNAEVYGNADVNGNAKVFGNAEVYERARVHGDAKISGKAHIFGDADISGTAVILGGNWDGSEGPVTSGKWKGPGIPA
jgi:carbonic anhydrase/acetyltransferase-like protein (isoleucine patch superfamily)